MLKIGEFSKLAQVSVKTLRYYAELGLLKPDWVDRYTGYRYYTLQQLRVPQPHPHAQGPGLLSGTDRAPAARRPTRRRTAPPDATAPG
ncbi:MAG: MerR family DNA-binding transcriptional regulator [Caldilineaceae bacterium]